MPEQSRMVTPARGVALAATLAAVCTLSSAYAAPLPGEGGDVQYWPYDGGGRMTGSALLFRKVERSDFSLAAGYRPDEMNKVSPDLSDSADPYSEQRDEYGFGLDYLYGNSVMSLNYFTAGETEYDAQLFSLGISHEVFGGITTFKMGLGGGDEPRISDDGASLEESIDRFNYTLGISQVLSRSLLMSVDYETILNEGFVSGSHGDDREPGLLAGAEIYPDSRTSNTVSLSALKSWTPGASTLFGYRYFWDSWDVQAHSWEAAYTSQLQNGWLVDLYYRYHTQERASFYGDDFQAELNVMAGDRELSAFVSNTLGAKFTYPVFRHSKGVTRGTLNLSYEIIDYDYDDFTDPSSGSNNPYSFSADTLHLYFSIWY